MKLMAQNLAILRRSYNSDVQNCKRKEQRTGRYFTFLTSKLGNSTNHLVRIDETSKEKSEEIEYFIHSVMRNELKGVFLWTDLDGKERRAYIKKNRCFIDRKRSQLMYQVYKKLEDKNPELNKKWRGGKLFINNVAVDIVRSMKQLQAVMDGEVVAKIQWK